MFLCSPRFELPMGTSEQPPLPLQIQNQGKVGKSIQDATTSNAFISGRLLQLCAHSLPQTAASSGRSCLSLIQLTNSSPGQRQQNNSNISHQNNMNANRGPRPLDQVTCYKVSPLRLCSCSVVAVSNMGRITLEAPKQTTKTIPLLFTNVLFDLNSSSKQFI